jgi:hypothetical protein
MGLEELVVVLALKPKLLEHCISVDAYQSSREGGMRIILEYPRRCAPLIA